MGYRVRIYTSVTYWCSHHPFGAFTNNTELSQIYVDMVLRNIVLSRVNAAVRNIKEAIAEVDEFAKVSSPHSNEIVLEVMSTL